MADENINTVLENDNTTPQVETEHEVTPLAEALERDIYEGDELWVTELPDGTKLEHPINVARFYGPPLQVDTDATPRQRRKRRSPKSKKSDE